MHVSVFFDAIFDLIFQPFNPFLKMESNVLNHFLEEKYFYVDKVMTKYYFIVIGLYLLKVFRFIWFLFLRCFIRSMEGSFLHSSHLCSSGFGWISPVQVQR